MVDPNRKDQHKIEDYDGHNQDVGLSLLKKQSEKFSSGLLEKNPSREDSQSVPIKESLINVQKLNSTLDLNANSQVHQQNQKPSNTTNQGEMFSQDQFTDGESKFKVSQLSANPANFMQEASQPIDQHQNQDDDDDVQNDPNSQKSDFSHISKSVADAAIKLQGAGLNKYIDPNDPNFVKDGESSSNYDASIFEDEDGDTSSDIMDDSEKDSPMPRFGTGLAQEQPNMHLGSGQLLTMAQVKSNGINNANGDDYENTDQSYGQLNKLASPFESTNVDESIHTANKSAKPSGTIKEEPAPLIKSGVSIAADMRFGWRPQQKELHGAPIPLHYDFESFKVPINPATNKPFQILFLGIRPQTSIDVHKKFSNIESLTLDQCPNPRPKADKNDKKDKTSKSDKTEKNLSEQVDPAKQQPYSSYTFNFPLKTPYMLPHSFDDRPAFSGMNPKLENPENELIFDSAFESGNLDMVIKTKPTSYDLYMRVDTNTRGHHQWFYFSVEVPVSNKKQSFTFRVVNFTKPHSLYTNGMRICYSKKSNNYLWQKGGYNIKYGRSHLVRRASPDPARQVNYSMLSFNFDVDKSKDNETEKVFFSYCFPYSFTMLQNFLKEVSLNQKESEIYKESVICKSLSGIDVPLVTISSRIKSDPKHYNHIKLSEFEDDESKLSLPMYKKKKYVIVGARVHPGESNSSYMMQGFIKYLLGDSHQAKQLRKRVVFKIVPMINADGVIIGNYRTSMSGNDLNRRYVKPDFRIHPTVCAIKQLASDLIYGPDEETKKAQSGEPVTLNEDILAFIDMHGHSRKKNVFIYGPQEPLHSDKYLRMRIIPKLIAEETQKFRYHSCRFRLEQSKLKAARIVMWREFGIMNCFTFEASFHGYFDQTNTNYEFTTQAYEEMGEHLGNSLFEYLMIMEEEERRKKLKEIAKKKKKKQKQQAMQKAAIMPKDQVQGSNFNANPANTVGASIASSVAHGSNSKDTSNNPLGQYLNLPPSGKSAKKPINQVGSSSSRARNVSHVTNKDSDKETSTAKKVRKADTLPKTKEKKKNIIIKSDASANDNIGNSSHTVSSRGTVARNLIQSQDQVREQDITNNPNEPPESELNVSGSETENQAQSQILQLGNIQIGSQDLRRSSNDEASRCTNIQLDEYEQESQTQDQNNDKKKQRGFRNLKDMFEAVRVQELEQKAKRKKKKKKKQPDEIIADESDQISECPSVASEYAEQPIADDELDDELSKEQQRKLHGDILNVITQFVKINNFKEHEYYGVSKQTLKKQKKVRANQIAAQINKEKEVKAGVELSDKPEKKKKNQSQQKRQSYQKDTIQTSGQQVNYQSNTLSVAQKRRSFNTAEAATVIPVKQVITNEQLNQQLQHMGGNKLKGGLGSPLYYNLYESTSNFSNFYVYRFDERGKPINNLQNQLLTQQIAQQTQANQAITLDQQNQEGSPTRKFQQHLQQAFIVQQQAMQQNQVPPQGYQSFQNNENGKIYHLSKNMDGSGNHHLVAQRQTNYAQNSQLPATQYGGAFGSRRSHIKDQLQSETQKQTQNPKDQILGHRAQAHSLGQAPTELNSQLEQMRQSQQQQAVQPMIFNFFNSKNDIKHRNHNRELKQSERNSGNTIFNNAASNHRGQDMQQHQQNRASKFVSSDSRKPPSIPNKQRDLLDSNFSGGLVGPTVVQSYNQAMLGTTQGSKNSPTVNERYPNLNQTSNSNNTSFQRQKAGIRQVANQQAVNSQNATVSHVAKNVGVSQKSRSSFNTRKQPPTQLYGRDNEISSPNQLASTNPVTMTQQQTRSAKFANITAATEIMKTSSQLGDQTQIQPQLAAGERFQTLPRQNAPSFTHQGSNRLVLQSLNSQGNATASAKQVQTFGSNGEAFAIDKVQNFIQHRQQTRAPDHLGQANQSSALGHSVNTQADQLFETSELKRNAIRQIHPLKTFNQLTSAPHNVSRTAATNDKAPLMVSGTSGNMPTSEFKMMSSTQDKFGNNAHNNHNFQVSNRHQSHQQHSSSNKVEASDSGINSINLQAQSPARGIKDRKGSFAKNIVPQANHQWQQDQNLQAAYEHTGLNDLDSMNYLARAPTTSAGIAYPLKHRLSYQDPNYQFQVGTTALSSANMTYLQSSSFNDSIQQDHGAQYTNMRQPNTIRLQNSTKSCDSSDKKVVEIRQKLSQLSHQNTEEQHLNQSKIGASSIIGVKRENQRIANDHSQLRRSGDYQTKIHKQVSREPISQQLLIGTSNQQSSSEIISQVDNASINKPLTTQTQYGQRFPPDPYLKNNHYIQSSQQVNQIQTQRLATHNQNSKSELRMEGAGPSTGLMLSGNDNFYNGDVRMISSPSRVQQLKNQTSMIPERKDFNSQMVDTEMNKHRNTHIQRNRMFNPGQQIQNYQLSQTANQIQLSSSKLMSVQNSTSLQNTPSQGIQNIFADPNYGIGGEKNIMSGTESFSMNKVNVATVGSKHLISPREETQYQDSQGIRDVKLLWSDQNTQSSADMNTMFDPSTAAAANSKVQNNQSVIRIQKSKYQGLIKQRGAPIIVHSPVQNIEEVDLNQNSSRATRNDGFISPSRKAQIQQVYNLTQQHQSKRVTSGQRTYGGEQVKNRGELFNRQAVANTMNHAGNVSNIKIQTAQEIQVQNQNKFSYDSKPETDMRKTETDAPFKSDGHSNGEDRQSIGRADIESSKKNQTQPVSSINYTFKAQTNKRVNSSIRIAVAQPQFSNKVPSLGITQTEPTSSTLKKRNGAQNWPIPDSNSKIKSKAELQPKNSGSQKGINMNTSTVTGKKQGSINSRGKGKASAKATRVGPQSKGGQSVTDSSLF